MVWYNGKKKRPGCIRSPGIHLTTFYENGLRLNRIALSKKSDSAEHPSQTAYVLHQIPEGREVVGGLAQAVHAVVDGDKAHTITWEDEFRVLTHLKVFTAQSGHVLDDECFHLTVFHQFHDLLPAWAIEVRSRVTVVIQEEGVGESFLSCILLEQKFLRWDLSRIFSANNMQCC